MNKKEEETSPSCSTVSGDVHKDEKSPSHFSCQNDNVIAMNKPVKHDVLHITCGCTDSKDYPNGKY